MKEVEVPSGPDPTQSDLLGALRQIAEMEPMAQLGDSGFVVGTTQTLRNCQRIARAAIEAYQKATQVESGLLANLRGFVQYRRKDGGHGWITMVAFDTEHIAQRHAFKTNLGNSPQWPWDYRAVDLAGNVLPPLGDDERRSISEQAAVVAGAEQERPSTDATPPLAALHDRGDIVERLERIAANCIANGDWERTILEAADRLSAFPAEAQEAAERIIEQHGNPVNFDLFCKDAATVARALLQGHDREAVIEKCMNEREWLRELVEAQTCSELCDKTYEFQGCPSGTCARIEGLKRFDKLTTHIRSLSPRTERKEDDK